jgi:hypothetical protein
VPGRDRNFEEEKVPLEEEKNSQPAKKSKKKAVQGNSTNDDLLIGNDSYSDSLEHLEKQLEIERKQI